MKVLRCSIHAHVRHTDSCFREPGVTPAVGTASARACLSTALPFAAEKVSEVCLELSGKKRRTRRRQGFAETLSRRIEQL